jgi:hypothetical protein
MKMVVATHQHVWRRRLGLFFYVLAALAGVYMQVGFVVTLIRNIRADGYFFAVTERIVTLPFTLVLWNLPTIIFLVIGRALRRAS